MGRLSRFFGRAVAAATLVVTFGAATAQEVVTLKVHHFQPPDSPAQVKFIAPWCEKVSVESAGRLRCQIFPAMQLGGTPAQLIDQVRNGDADIVWTATGYSAGRFPAAEVFELPFMTRTAAGSSRALWEYVKVNRLDESEFDEVRPILFHVLDAGELHLTRGPIRELADFRGLKLRAPTRQTVRFLSALGATPVGMPAPQVSETLSKGLIDGAMLPWAAVPTIKANALMNSHSETDPQFAALYTTVFVFAMNRAKYERLPDDLKKVIDANGGAEASAWVGRIYDEAGAKARQRAVERGDRFNTVPAAELKNWEKAGKTVYEAWTVEVSDKGYEGKALLRSARELIHKYDAAAARPL